MTEKECGVTENGCGVTENGCGGTGKRNGVIDLGQGVVVKKIALAQDVAFSFIYEHVLARWREQGVEILPFSPLLDESPDMSADICWLAGGYPELYAEKLAGNKRFLQGLKVFAEEKSVHGECGGYMMLGEILIDKAGKEWEMAGLLPLVTSFAKRKLHLGYRVIKLAVDSPIGEKNVLVRGHEFHYASVIKQGKFQSLGEMYDANGDSLGCAGMQLGNVTGSFFHMVAGG